MFSTLSRGVNRPVVEKFLFRWGAIAAGKPTELSARGHDPVARDDDRDWIGAAGLADGLLRATEFFCHFAIGSHFPIGNGEHASAYSRLEIGECRGEGEVEGKSCGGGVFAKLAGCLFMG